MQLAKKTGIPSDWTTYKQHNSITQKQVRQVHWNYVNAILNKSLKHGINKPFWKYIIIIIMVIFKCYFSGELIALT